MSLTASMWTSVSGLLCHGERMNVIGNNISNVNTVGFKSQRMDFQDFVYQGVGTAAGPGQVGRGTSIGIVMNDFSQGSLETTTSSTDIAISGNGFFAVRPQTNNMTYYTRAGNFSFDRNGNLVDPHGYVLQGWAVERSNQFSASRTSTGIIGTGSPVDVKLDSFTCPPRATQNIVVPVNLKNSKVATDDDNSTDKEDPFFALLKTWDATQEQPLGANSYAYQSTMEVYDEAGKLHKLTIYYDRVSNSDASRIDEYTDSESYWEYIITMDPAEDVRDFSSEYNPNLSEATTPDVPDKLKGLLAAGTITFSSNGEMKDITCFVPHTDGSDSDHWWTGSEASAKVDLDKWIAAPINSDGLPVIAPNFSGAAGLSQAYQNGIWDQPNANAAGRLVAVDLGLRSKIDAWNFAGDPSGNMPPTYVDTAGNVTDLVKASGISRTWDEQVTKEGKYVWEGTSTDPATNLPYEILSATTREPSGDWGTAPVGSNATEFYWTLEISVSATDVLERTVTTSHDNASFNVILNPNNPFNSETYRYGATGSSAILRVEITRAPSEIYDDMINPYDMAPATWTKDEARSNNTTEFWTSKDGSITIVAPAGSFTSSAQVHNAIASETWGRAQPQPAGSASKANWVVATATGEIVSEPFPSDYDPGLTPYQQVPPGFTEDPDARSSNATEYYWADRTNPSTILTAGPVAGEQNIMAGQTPPDCPSATAVMQTLHASNRYFINGLGVAGDLQNVATTCLGDNFYEHSGRKQDGYTYGDLRNVNVSTDGILTATYSNGVTLELYQLTLYDFPSTQNLRREGGNLYSQTAASGPPNSGAAGTGTFGTTQSYSLEQSNVDLSREFVNMIATQRGFQANSKGITTVDTMLETVISMKR